MKLILWAAAEEVAFKVEAEVITAQEAYVAAKENLMMDVDEEANMAEEEGKTRDINGPDLMPAWYSVMIVRR